MNMRFSQRFSIHGFLGDFKARKSRPLKTILQLFSVGFPVVSLSILLVLILVSCGSTRHVQVVESIHHDTIYLNKVQYDSVFYSIDHYIDRTSDTIYVRDVSVQYKYKLLRDTLRIHEVDSIPVIKEVEITKEVRYVPWWSKVLNWIGFVLLIGLVLRIAIKLYLHKL